MENRTGILRNAPTGIKLYSPVFGDCKLSCVIEDEMTIEYFDGKNPNYITLDKYGRFKEDGECILYPNKYKHDWNGWQAWLFRDELSIGQVVVDALGGYFIIINNSDDIKVADASGKEHILESKELDKFRFATQAERIEFFEYLERNHCYWDNEAKAILENTKKEEFIEEPKNNSKFKDGDIVTVVNHYNDWADNLIGIVIGPYIFGSDLSKMSINKALRFEVRYATEQENNIFVRDFLSEWKEPKESLDTDEEPKEFCDEDAKEAANEWCRCFKCDGIVNETGLKCSKTRLLTCPKWYDSYKASSIALETYKRKLKENKEPKELYTDEEAKEFASKVSHEWWQMAMDKWNTLTEDEKKKNNQFIGFNDFSDHLMNILRSVLLGLKRNGKLIYEEGSLFSEPDQKLTEIELDETPDGVVCMPSVLDDQVQTITEGIAPKVSINSRFAKVEPSDLTPIEEPKEELDETPIPCYEPKYFSCTGNCGNCVYHTTAGCSKKIEYDKSGCVSTDSSNCTNKYIPKLKVGDKACLSDKNDNIYFEEILKVNDEEYYTKTFGWINCKAIDELHEINFKEYNKPFTINDFKPFDKVLWRLGPSDTWTIGLYDNYYIAGENDKISYSVLGYEKDWVPQCVPYNIDTAYLHDTDKEYEGKYKTW